jgi:hypothetical protein
MAPWSRQGAISQSASLAKAWSGSAIPAHRSGRWLQVQNLILEVRDICERALVKLRTMEALSGGSLSAVKENSTFTVATAKRPSTIFSHLPLAQSAALQPDSGQDFTFGPYRFLKN